jgi:uncharacterized membrane protein YtjA (UPF0391 family)
MVVAVSLVADSFWQTLRGDDPMLYYAMVFLIIALVAGALGFFGIAGAAAGIAKILFFVFIALFIVGLIAGMGTTRGV